MASVAVIGAGLAGLTAALRLRALGHNVSVYEADGRAGGRVRSERIEGYLVEHGPNSMAFKGVLDGVFLGELGLSSVTAADRTRGKNRYILCSKGSASGQQELVPIPTSLSKIFTTPLFSLRAKLGVLAEPFVAARPADDERDESLAEFITRRLGPEILDYAVNPFVTGVYAGDPREMSLRYTFPALYRMEYEHGSLLRGSMAFARERKQEKLDKERELKRQGRSDPVPGVSGIFSFPEGLQEFTDRLHDKVKDSVALGTPVVSISHAGPRQSGWVVTHEVPGGGSYLSRGPKHVPERFDAVVYTGPINKFSGLLRSLPADLDLTPFDRVEYTPVSLVMLGYKAADVGHALDGFGFLVPEKEPCKVLGTIFSSQIFEGRAPEGHVLLTNFVGGARQPEHARMPTDEIIEMTAKEVERILDIKGQHTFAYHVFWEEAIPQYAVGYGQVVQLLKTVERRCPGLFFAGNYDRGVAVGDAVTSGFHAAQRVHDFVGGDGADGSEEGPER